MNYRKAQFVKSATSLLDSPLDFPHVVFIGRSNVGKSSLINALTENKSLAFTSKTPGRTQLLNYFLIDNAFYLVDAPGYGYRRLSKKDPFEEMMNSYFSSNQALKMVVWLLDSRLEPSPEDMIFYQFMKASNIKPLICLTKADKLNQSLKHKALKFVQEQFKDCEFIFTSVLKNLGFEELRSKITLSIS